MSWSLLQDIFEWNSSSFVTDTFLFHSETSDVHTGTILVYSEKQIIPFGDSFIAFGDLVPLKDK